jgi:hypothetical protein
MKHFLLHLLWILDNLYTGSISLLFRFFLCFYLFVLVLIIILLVVTWLILSSLIHFFHNFRRSA